MQKEARLAKIKFYKKSVKNTQEIQFKIYNCRNFFLELSEFKKLEIYVYIYIF